MTSRHIPVVGFVSLGCPKALVDTERIVTELRARGYRIGSTYKDADVVIVNTCGFVNEAVEESLGAIAEALKENGRVIVCGCLGGRTEADGSNFIMVRHPKVIGVTGPDSVDEVLAMVEGVLPRPHDPWDDLVPAAGVRLTPKHYAYLKISEGCNHHCTFCVIPHLRGSLNSRSMDSIIREAMNLKAAGVKELLVISQDTAAYGVDKRYKLDFACGEKNLERIAAWRRACPDITIRSTFIVGFPGETEAEFEYLLDFLREAELDRVGCFAYSPVDGAAANDLPGALPDEVREERRRRFMEVQAEISLRKLARRIGRIEDVIIDEEPDEDGVAVGRTKSDAPDIDGVCYVTTDRKLVPGDIVPVRITANEEHDLVGREVVA